MISQEIKVTTVIDESQLMTPTEIIKEFPNCGLRKQDIGFLIRLGVVSGRKFEPRGTFVDKQSFVNYLNYVKTVPKMKFCRTAC